MFLYYIPHEQGHSILGFETIVAMNFRCSHCKYVQFNTGCFLFSVIFNKCTSCNLIHSSNIVADLRIIVEV